jgi:hypothetical protein
MQDGNLELWAAVNHGAKNSSRIGIPLTSSITD